MTKFERLTIQLLIVIAQILLSTLQAKVGVANSEDERANLESVMLDVWK